MVATAPRLKIHQTPDTVVDGRPIKAFQYRTEPEDNACAFKSVLDLGFFSVSKFVSPPCFGEVWTDQEFNILRISQHLELSGKWKAYESVVTYGWLRRANEPARFIPITILTQAESGKRTYWCRGWFTNYRIYDAQAKIVSDDYVQSLPH